MAMSKWWESLRWFGVSIAPGVGGFWHWWWQSLLAWLPMRCRVANGAALRASLALCTG